MDRLTVAGGTATLLNPSIANPQSQSAAPVQTGQKRIYFDVQNYGAKGDGASIDSPSINAAIDAAASASGGTVIFSAGVCASYSIHLKSNLALFLQQGATILAAPTQYLELSNVEIATESADARPAFYLDNVDGADFFRLKFTQRQQTGQFGLKSVSDFRLFGCHHSPDATEAHADDKTI